MNLLAPIALAAALFISPLVAHASLVGINFTVTSSAGGTVTGSGTAFTDSSNLDAGDVTINPADLFAMNLSLTGVPGAPSSTTFSKVDLNDIEWVLSVNGAGIISDLNFFMRNGTANADGYSIEGVSPFHSVLCLGAAVGVGCADGVNAVLDQLVITVTGVQDAVVPEPLSIALTGIALLGLCASRRKAAARQA